MVIPENARTWAVMNDVPLPPANYDLIKPPAGSADVNISSPAMYSYLAGEVKITGTAAGEGFDSYNLQVGQGLNPQSWLQIGEGEGKKVTDGSLGTWQTDQEGLFAIRLQVLREDNEVETDIIQVTVDNTPPVIEIVYPLDNQKIERSPSENIILEVWASDSTGISKIEWYLNDTLIGQKTDLPYIHLWKPGPGNYELFAKATDLAGNSTDSEVVRFSVP